MVRIRIRLVCLSLALLVGLALFYGTPLQVAVKSSAGLQDSPKLDSSLNRAIDDLHQQPPAFDFHKFALNALLVPLMDDSTPPRWTDAALDYNCDIGTRVLVNGQPMEAGELVPATPFHVRWDIDHCEPVGPAAQLSGGVDLQVFHDFEGMTAIVTPDRLQMTGSAGKFTLTEAFSAELSLVTPTN